MREALLVDVRAELRADPSQLIALAIDLDRLRALHPRLVAARWRDELAAVGSRAEITVSIPPWLRLLRPLIGPPHGTLTLLDLEPARRVRFLLHAPHLTGEVELIADPASGGGSSVTVRGHLRPKSGLARAATLPSTTMIEHLMTRSARRTLARADTILLTHATSS